MSNELRDLRGQRKVGGKRHVHRERSVHIFGACRCVKLWAACFAGRVSGIVGRVQVLPYRSSLTLPHLIMTALTLMWCCVLFRNQSLVSDACRRLIFVVSVVSHTPLCLISLLFFGTWLDFLGVLYSFSFGALLPSLSALALLHAWLFKQIW